ncbi:MAG: PDZ domain-containing protein [Planctomycetota bacterium]|nr:PDZ domain-containing protein [Planctomycetota bacterium]
MSVRTVVTTLVVGGLVVLLAGPARADETADRIRRVREQVVPSTVIVSFYIERDDGARADAHVLGTVVGKGNLVMFASVAIPSRIPLSQFRDFKVTVTDGDDLNEYEAAYLGKDGQAQVAFLKVTDPKAPTLPVLAFDEAAEVRLGDPLLTLANLGEPDGFARVVQITRVSVRLEQPVTTYLCTKGMGSPGTPVMTLEGKAVGIVGLVRINRATNARPKWSLAEVLWPAERFIERLRQPPKGGTSVKQAWLGVHTLTPVTKDLADYFDLGDRRGVVVGQVIEGSPADKADLRPEDIILAVGDEAVSGTEGQLVENFVNRIRECEIGEKVKFTVWRDGKTRPVTVTLTPQPKGPGEAERYASKPFGMTVRKMVVEDRISRELPEAEKGVVVSFLKPAGWAADGGLQMGDIIKKVQDRPTPDLAAFKKVFEDVTEKKPKEVVLFVLRGKKDTQLVRIEPRW